jgi:hypothetical protein
MEEWQIGNYYYTRASTTDLDHRARNFFWDKILFVIC